MASSKVRQSYYRERMRTQGYESVTVWVPFKQSADFREVAKQLCANGSLELGPLRNVETGKLQKKVQ